MKQLSFSEWVNHWGESKLDERIKSCMDSHRSRWVNRLEHYKITWYPCWELNPGMFWKEPWPAWMQRWTNCGGKIFEGSRLIAQKKDPIWGKLSATFLDGFGNPYPPYARSSCAFFVDVSARDAIALGVISKEEAGIAADELDEDAFEVMIANLPPDVEARMKRIWSE